MKIFAGKTLRWEWREGVIELTLDHEPANEIGSAMLAELEKFVAAFDVLAPQTSVCIIASARSPFFPLAEICASCTRPRRQFQKKIAPQACALFLNASTPF